jgi:hypothetical protein
MKEDRFKFIISAFTGESLTRLQAYELMCTLMPLIVTAKDKKNEKNRKNI